MLRKLKQPVSGKKAVLIERIMENVVGDFLSAHCPKKMYKLSEIGIDFPGIRCDYIQVHKHKNCGASWQEYDQYAKAGQDFLATMRNVFNRRLQNDSIHAGSGARDSTWRI